MSENDGPPLQGALLAIEDINAKGGVLGRKLKPVFADTKSDQTEGAKAGQSVLAQGANFMVVSCDYDMAPGRDGRQRRQMPTFSLCASDAKMGVQGIGPYAFTMANTSLSFGASLAQFAGQKKGFKTAYLLLDTSIEYPKGICAGFQEQWEKQGGKIAGEDTFKQDDASIASQITRMQQAAATTPIDFIMICSYSAGDVSAVKQIRGAGINTRLAAATRWTATTGRALSPTSMTTSASPSPRPSATIPGLRSTPFRTA